jgi:2'-deoxynucleoside 5'-phosphate N-hydrolase
MNIYFACSITGGRAYEPVYQAIIAALQADGHTLPTAHLAGSDVMELEALASPVEVYERDVTWIRECQALLAEVSTPSHGVGYEVAYALSIGKPVLCIHQAGHTVSKMLTGNTHPNLQVSPYPDIDQALVLIRAFLLRVSVL